MKIRTKNKQRARLRKRRALAQTLRRELLLPLNVSGQPRQLAVDAAHRQPSGPRGPARRIHSPSPTRTSSGNPKQRKSSAHAQIVAYGAAAIADGTRIVRVDESVEIVGAREGDRFGVDSMGQSAMFDVVSVGFHPNSLELDRPLPRGRYGWSIQRDRRDADRACESPQVSAAPVPAAFGSATLNPPPQVPEAEVATHWRVRGASTMRFDGKTRIERYVPRDPHLSNEANQLEGNEATFAFWLNRSATVIRDETLMLAVDHVTAEAFAIELSPAVVRSSSTDSPFRFDIKVTPKSGSEARPVRWAIEHPRSVHGWQFIALVTDREGGVRLWLDGRNCERQQSTHGIAHHDYLSLGDGALGNGIGGNRFETLIPTGLRDTLLDSFAVWSRSLSGDELRTAMSDSPLAATEDGSLQLYWRLSASLHIPQASNFRGPHWSSKSGSLRKPDRSPRSGSDGFLGPRPAGETARTRGARERIFILDASGTLRHGLRITGLQSQEQDWRALPASFPPGAYDVPSDLAG